jgi:hypothetical protein
MKETKGNNSSGDIIWPSYEGDGTHHEDFWKYLAGVVLRERGYFVSRYGSGGGYLCILSA